MKVTTTGGKPKPFAWSYSKLKNFESCPKRYYNVDVAKIVKEDESEALSYGNTLHKVLANALSGKEGLPEHFRHLQEWVDKLVTGQGKILVEQQLAIRSDMGPTEWFGKDVWYRAIADFVKIQGPVALAIDWKTGKILEDGVQLALMAQCLFSHYPEVQAIRTEFVWLKEDATSRADFTRADMLTVWNGVLPRVQLLENAHRAMDFPPKPGFLCRKWCPVDKCPHHGI